MYVWLVLILGLLAVIAGLGLGGLNAQPVTLHLVIVNLDATLGVLVTGAFALGLLLGVATVYCARVLPLRFRLRHATRAVGGTQGLARGNRSGDRSRLSPAPEEGKRDNADE